MNSASRTPAGAAAPVSWPRSVVGSICACFLSSLRHGRGVAAAPIDEAEKGHKGQPSTLTRDLRAAPWLRDPLRRRGTRDALHDVATLSVLVAAELFLVVELSHPFIGEIATSPEPLREVVQLLSPSPA